ncbi:methyltransferase domain-containing protein [Alicyclobacillus sp.]|uniref:class I SAM-dependent methyltransferase n=1 Tax=Alicyclobacillus sp. TaxID=61169 RepID=UPI0025BCD9B9|nr:methyltransferase domain-containing protein [Alicyclobacillus sp.]
MPRFEDAQRPHPARPQDVKPLVQAQFARTADRYVASPSHAHGPDLAKLVTWLAPDPEWVCLDVATGGGHVARTLSPWVSRVIASDLTPQMLMAARRHLTESGCRNVTFVIADAENLPFLPETFDAVTCRIAPHHFPNPDRFVEEVARVLKPGGRFLMVDNVAPQDPACARFLNDVERLRDPGHVRCPAVTEWRRWLEAAGLREIRSEARRKRNEFPSWMARMARSPEHAAEVESFILHAAPEVRACFDVEIRDGRVLAMSVDEWMVLCVKRA